MRINIVDAGCGVGKTTALINKINEDNTDQKYLFITPFLTEVDRIKTSCPSKKFVSPKETDDNKTKLKNFIKLIENGENIVTTHALFKKLNKDILNVLLLKDYILIMDEVADLVDELSISKSDLKTISEKYISVNPHTHMAEWIDSSYSGKFDNYMEDIQKGNVFAHIDNKGNIVSLLWLFPYIVFEYFKQIYILTYMFDGQIQKKYFDYFGATYALWYVKNFYLTATPQKYDYSETKNKIHVCNDAKLNDIGNKTTALSLSWFRRNKRTNKMVILQNNMRSFFRSYAKASVDIILWTTFKESKNDLKRRFATGFAPINSRATNEYGHKKVVAYIGNRYFKPTIKNFFYFNNISTDQGFEDKFALSEMVQFIYRSAIRNNEEIVVYIPSKRMRNLFINWLNKKDE